MNTKYFRQKFILVTVVKPTRNAYVGWMLQLRRTWSFLLFCPLLVFALTPAVASSTNAVAQPEYNLLSDLTNKLTRTTNLDTVPGTNRMEALDDKYVLAIGDHLSFQILEDQDDPKELFVTDSGELELPYIGRVSAEGKTCRKLAGEIKSRLDKDYYYNATVIVAVDTKTKDRGKIYLVGSVRMPGPQQIPSDEVLTVSKAIMRAGGFSDFADEKNVRVTRKGSGANAWDQTFTVNVQNALEKGKTEGDLPLEPGDSIYIPSRVIRF